MTAAESRTRSTDNRLYGLYEAQVTDVNDPEKEGRVKIKMVNRDMELDWCPVRQFYAGNGYGAFYIPEVGDQIVLAFVEGDMRHPYILGSVYYQGCAPPSHRDAQTDQKMLRTKAGHVFVLDDSPGKECVRITTKGGHEFNLSDGDKKAEVKTSGGHSIALEDGGSKVTIQTSGGQSLTLTPGTVTLKAQNIVLDAASVALGGAGAAMHPVLAEKLLAAFNTHTHNCTAPGSPSGPPVPPLTPAINSTLVKMS